MTRRFIFIVCFGISAVFLWLQNSYANNLSITNFNFESIDTDADTVSFTFDIDWDNSWRSAADPDNYDAAWIFMKYSEDGGRSWSHATMSAAGTDPTGFTVPSGFEIKVPTDKMGFFFQRDTTGTGSVSEDDVIFVWDYGTDGLSDATAQAATTTAKIFGIEMVYVSEGSFYAGGTGSIGDFQQGSSDTDPWYITSEGAISVTDTESDGYYYTNGGASASNEDATGSAFTIEATFPKGYNDFYLMKYELTEGQWVDFFNTLTPAQKSTRDITSNDATQGGKNSDSTVKRNTISWDSSATTTASASTSRPDRAVSYIGWPDACAYADWAALRPFTELEFEKACRGEDQSVVSSEYCWGTTSVTEAGAGGISGTEDGTETITTAGANVAADNSLTYTSGDGGIGPLRAGIFAEGSTTREEAGAAYYGNMNMADNLMEMTVSVGNSEGRGFQGTHGDGELTATSSYEGNATNTDWPGIDSTTARGVTGTIGMGFRGNNFKGNNNIFFQTSTRYTATLDPESEGYLYRYETSEVPDLIGTGRFARDAP